MPDDPQTTKITVPGANPKNVQGTKYYVFNETGNIMIASTVDSSEPIQESVQRIYAEVSVFFAAMTKSISTSTNPDTGKPYTLYNYEALEKVIDGSGLFVHVTEEDVEYTSSGWGVQFSKEMVEALLGLATGEGELSFASAMIQSIGKAGLEISGEKASSSGKVGNIIFVCEYLLGMPIVSAIVVYMDVEKHEQQIKVGPCFNEHSQSMKWTMHKDTYMFVTPTLIREYAADLDSVKNQASYQDLINWLKGIIAGKADTPPKKPDDKAS
ncbi:MAG: hypothetical protein ACPHID_07600 [Thermoplasmatota archaeon]